MGVFLTRLGIPLIAIGIIIFIAYSLIGDPDVVKDKSYPWIISGVILFVVGQYIKGKKWNF